MDWNAAVEKNREALKRILAMLAAMAGLGAGALGAGGLGAGGQFTLFPQKDAAVQNQAQAEKSKPSPALNPAPSPPFTLPRRAHRAILSLLRPAESAVRRLIIVAARGLVVTLPPPRPRKTTPKPKMVPTAPILRRLGIAVTMSREDFARAAEAERIAALRAARPRTMTLPLLDPMRQPFRVRRRTVPPHAAPRILSLDIDAPFHRLPPPPMPRDQIDAARLVLRMQALAKALDDLPGQAKRYARWTARRDAMVAQRKALDAAAAKDREVFGVGVPFKRIRGAGVPNAKTAKPVRFFRLSAMKPGRPPGWRRKPTHEVHEVLDVVHGLAVWALEKPRTS